MNVSPSLQLDALALTAQKSLSIDVRILERRFITLSRRAKCTTDQNYFSTSRYRHAIRLQMEPDKNGTFDSTKPWLLIQTVPKNEANDSPLQIELKAFPYSDKHFVTARETIKYLLGIDGPLDASMFLVTRIDIAVDFPGDIRQFLFHRSKTRITETSYGRGGRLRCIRLGRSKSKRYVVVYGRKWRESRHSPLLPSGMLRIELRSRPRVSLSEVLDSIDLSNFLASFYLYELERVEASGVLDAQTLSLCKHFGLTPILMSCQHSTRKRLLRYLRRYRLNAIEGMEVVSSINELQRQLNLMSGELQL